ncbi:hypothetical protein M758_7G098700 [Ceratodon purpureus]|nr:hypothetical protein M758_7G098700 [Ceratodon purpureus]
MSPNPLFESLFSNSSSTDSQRNAESPASPGSLVSGAADKRWPRFTSVFWRACCVGCFVALLLYPTVMFLSEVNSNSDIGFRGEFGNNTSLIDAASWSLRTSYHFRPEKNWMNDPNGPVFYKGFYHFFYQYNPYGAAWGDIVWGHAVSRDMIQWVHLDIALVPDKWYDVQGVWSGSITVGDDGIPIILYTGSSYSAEQTQNIAYPEDPSDPLLRKWVKDHDNPVLRHPRGIDYKDFRDPTTAWKDADGYWLMTVGAKMEKTGLALLYRSVDLKHWELQNNVLHAVLGTGMWECVDFYPVAVQGHHGLDSYIAAPTVKYVLKASLDDDKHDYYALGSYDTVKKTFHPDDTARDTGIGLRYDYGKFYASKSFFDPEKQRRILWGWVNESDSLVADIAKGWASVQAIPRSVWFDSKTMSNLIQEPIEEVKTLRGTRVTQKDVKLAPGDVVEVTGAVGGQLDIELVFDYPYMTNPAQYAQNRDHYDCNQGGAAYRGVFGPFGLLVLADEYLQEQTAVFFYVSYSRYHNKWTTKFCSDQTRSSLWPDVDTTVYGSFVEVLPSEDFLSLRVLVDGSIVESFAQGGRVVITSRVYPTIAADQNARLYLFNNATTAINVRSIDAWQMSSVPLRTI